MKKVYIVELVYKSGNRDKESFETEHDAYMRYAQIMQVMTDNEKLLLCVDFGNRITVLTMCKQVSGEVFTPYYSHDTGLEWL